MGKFKAKKSTDIKNDFKQSVIKEKRLLSESEETARNFMIILLICLVVIGGVLLATKLLLEKREDSNTNTNEVTIDYNAISVGTLLNRVEDNYYVFVYDTEDQSASVYAYLKSEYSKKDNAKRVYTLDLSDSFNAKYKSGSEKGNSKAVKLDELSFGTFTLLEVKKGKIVTYKEGYETIKKYLTI